MTPLGLLTRGLGVWDEASPPGARLGLRVAGSRLHGTHTPASDYDWYGVYVAPTAAVLAAAVAPVPDTVSRSKGPRAGAGDDYGFHEVGKYLQILMKGNANAVEFLFGGEFAAGPATPTLRRFWEELYAHRRAFLTRGVVESYLAYADGQLKRIATGRLGPAREGETWKDVGHGVRLLHEGLRVARGEEPFVRVPDDPLAERWPAGGVTLRAFVADVRAGRVSSTTILLHATGIKTDIRERLAAGPACRPEPPRAWAADWLVRLRRALLESP
jgi:hypothetical protein